MPWHHTLQPAIESTKLTIAILIKTLVHRLMMIKLAGQPAASKPAVPRSSSGVSHLVRTLVEEVLAWQGRNGIQRIPNKCHDDSEEHNLGIRFAKVLLRRDKALGIEPCRSQLSPSEVALVNSVPGVPLRGCSATASCNGQPDASKPTVPSLSERRSSSGVSHLVRTLVEEVLAWQEHNGAQRIPNKHAGSFYDDSEERKLGIRFGKVLLRRDKSLGSAPSGLQLSPSEVALVNSIPGVPLSGCSATASCNSNVAQQRPGLTTILNDDIGTHHANKRASVGSAGTGSSGSHHASQSNRIEEGESPSSDLAAKKRRVVATLPVADVVTSVSTCSMCFDKPCVAAVVPCGHLCGCFDCLQLCHVCPICTDPIQTILRVYDAGISP